MPSNLFSRLGRALALSGTFVVFLALITPVLVGQEDALSWFPLQIGSRWVYEHEWKAGDPERPKITRWITEETVTGLVTLPEGLVVLRKVKTQDQSGTQDQPGAYVARRGSSHYLVRGSCIYFLDDSSWDSTQQVLRPNYRYDLINGSPSPDLCFPLQNGSQWGTTRDTPWRVAGLGDPADPNAFRIISDHFGSGGQMEVWFEKGVGIMGERYLHQGTYEEYTERLLTH